MRQFTSFREFYPFYLSEHADRRSRRMHFAGTTLIVVLIGDNSRSGGYRSLYIKESSNDPA